MAKICNWTLKPLSTQARGFCVLEGEWEGEGEGGGGMLLVVFNAKN